MTDHLARTPKSWWSSAWSMCSTSASWRIPCHGGATPGGPKAAVMVVGSGDGWSHGWWLWLVVIEATSHDSIYLDYIVWIMVWSFKLWFVDGLMEWFNGVGKIDNESSLTISDKSMVDWLVVLISAFSFNIWRWFVGWLIFFIESTNPWSNQPPGNSQLEPTERVMETDRNQPLDAQQPSSTMVYLRVIAQPAQTIEIWLVVLYKYVLCSSIPGELELNWIGEYCWEGLLQPPTRSNYG